MPKAAYKIPPAVAKRAKQIKVVLMDVDGTLTDGGVTLLSQPDGSALEIKTFSAHDGQGLTLARTAGLRTGVITGRGWTQAGGRPHAARRRRRTGLFRGGFRRRRCALPGRRAGPGRNARHQN